MRQKGYTLVELILVIVIIGILAVYAEARFFDLTDAAKEAMTAANLETIRSVITIRFTKNATEGHPEYPDQLVAIYFGGSRLPINKITGKSGIATLEVEPLEGATSDTHGFWYVPSLGRAGEYNAPDE